VGAVPSHDHCAFEFFGDLELVVSFQSVRDLVEAVVHGEELGDVIYSEVSALLEDPRRGEKARPDVHVVHPLRLRVVEEPGHSPDLLQLLRPHRLFNNHVQERQRHWMVLHAHRLKIVKRKVRYLF